MEKIKYCIIGSGVIGLAIANRIAEDCESVVIIEQNKTFGAGISSRNSEVIHAGIYYPKNSLKAELCVRGRHLLYEYCRKNNIPHQKLGKLIVAGSAEEEELLLKKKKKAEENGVTDLQHLTTGQTEKMEPELDIKAALFSPSTGILNVHQYMLSLLRKAESNGASFVADTKVLKIGSRANEFTVQVSDGSEPFAIRSDYVINAAGLDAPDVAKKIEGIREDVVPTQYLCKGDYFKLHGKNPFSHLVYPVPQPDSAGLGVHATLDLDGRVRFGPDAEYVDSITYDVSPDKRETFYHAIKRYYPGIKKEDLEPDYAGIRPKLQPPGGAFHDFQIQSEEDHGIQNLVNLFGIESPGLTSSLAIAERVTQKLTI